MNDEELRHKIIGMRFTFESVSDGGSFEVSGIPSDETVGKLLQLIKDRDAKRDAYIKTEIEAWKYDVESDEYRLGINNGLKYAIEEVERASTWNSKEQDNGKG
jgi:hypothetical protein